MSAADCASEDVATIHEEDSWQGFEATARQSASHRANILLRDHPIYHDK
jgi:hypothetical protein